MAILKEEIWFFLNLEIQTMRYVVVTPAYNEQEFIKKTLESMVNQELLPQEWVIVNDNSTDDTASIVAEYAKLHPWIKLVNKLDEDDRKIGAKVVRIFYYGLDHVSTEEFDFLVKLDADLELPLNYFKETANAFHENPKIGICAGYCIVPINDQWIEEKVAHWHTRGAMKAYRKECYDEIGGIKPVMGWDGIDDITAMSKGWETKTLRLAVKHFRPTGQASDPIKLRIKQGKSYYQRGYGFILTVIRMLSKFYSTKSPYEIYLLKGFFDAWRTNTPKCVEPEVEKFTRRFQYKRIFKLKY